MGTKATQDNVRLWNERAAVMAAFKKKVAVRDEPAVAGEPDPDQILPASADEVPED